MMMYLTLSSLRFIIYNIIIVNSILSILLPFCMHQTISFITQNNLSFYRFISKIGNLIMLNSFLVDMKKICVPIDYAWK
jgi:hypothetical protein